MKREQLLKHWTVIEAFRNGKQVQVKTPDRPPQFFVDTDSPNFDLYLDYRIKPEKKEGWVNVWADTSPAFSGHMYSSKAAADKYAVGSERIACVKVVYEEGEGL